MKTDVAMTWISGDSYCKSKGVEIYLNSLSTCGFKGERLIFTHEMTKEDERRFKLYGCVVHKIPKASIANMQHDRHLVYYKHLLANTDKYRYVIITDGGDVAFQKNPIDYLELIYIIQDSEFAILVEEGLKHEGNYSNVRDQQRFQEGIGVYSIPFSQWPVINAGIMLGTPKRLQHLLFNVWLASMRIKCGDQAALNFIYRHLVDDHSIFLVNPKDSPLCVTGEGLLATQYTPLPMSEYYIFHQWNRTNYAAKILEMYGSLP